MAVTSTSRVPTDVVSGALITIENDHHEIHDGKSFTAQFSRTTAATNGHRSGLLFKTPATGRIHVIAAFASSAAANFSIAEAPTVTANVGTHANAIYNRDRNSAVAATVKDNATSPAANKFTSLDETQIAADGSYNIGTVIRTAPITTASGPFAAGGSARGEQEYILKADTKYLFLVTNTSATATTHWILVDWYEEA